MGQKRKYETLDMDIVILENADIITMSATGLYNDILLEEEFWKAMDEIVKDE